MSNMKCFCGHDIKINNNLNCCTKCSSTYNKYGKFIPSRHNWNIQDYFSSSTFFKNNFNVSAEAPELNPFEL